MNSCIVDGCGRKTHGKKDYCSTHYQRAKQGKDMSAPVRVWARNIGVCSIDGCSRPKTSNQLCAIHNDRYHRGKEMGAPVRKTPLPPGSSWFDPLGYEKRTINGKHVSVHRHVMEQMLGRGLLPHETVHHKNGQRADNRPENLELWSTHQPRGQRVQDKLAFAREIITQYEGTAADPNPPKPAVMDPTELRDVMERMLRKQLQRPLPFPVSA